MIRRTAVAVIVLAVALLAYASVLIVDETQYAIVTRFGDPTRIIRDAGLHFKIPPPVENVIYLDRRLLVLDIPKRDEPPREFLTLDKKNIEVATYTCWKIRDPLKFHKSAGTRSGAEAILRDIVLGVTGRVLAENNLDALISVEPNKMRMDALMDEIQSTCARLVGDEYGIDIADVRIRRMNFPDQNRSSVFERMRAERKQFATQYLGEGETAAAKIRSEADAKRDEILAEAYKQARIIEGQAESKALRTYADAYAQAPDFYEFLRTLESYEKTLTRGTTIFLPADSPYLKWLSPGDTPHTAGDESTPHDLLKTEGSGHDG